jgi:hypothetical protein
VPTNSKVNQYLKPKHYHWLPTPIEKIKLRTRGNSKT